MVSLYKRIIKIIGINNWIAAKNHYCRQTDSNPQKFYRTVWRMTTHRDIEGIATWLTRDGLQMIKDHAQYQ